jgi:hypothetical protein
VATKQPMGAPAITAPRRVSPTARMPLARAPWDWRSSPAKLRLVLDRQHLQTTARVQRAARSAGGSPVWIVTGQSRRQADA